MDADALCAEYRYVPLDAEQLLPTFFDARAGIDPDRSTTGGTSDARFIKDYCEVVEYGLVGETMHQIDERVAIADLEGLTRIYRGIIENYFSRA